MIYYHACQRSKALHLLAELGVPKSAYQQVSSSFLRQPRGFLLVIEDVSALHIPVSVINHAKSPGWTTIIAKQTAAEFNAARGGFR